MFHPSFSIRAGRLKIGASEHSHAAAQAMLSLSAKRVYDLVLAGAGLVVLSPVLAVIGLLIKISDGGPVFYRQQRVGQAGRLFDLWKFRSMVPHAQRLGPSVTADGDRRITRVGRFLRRTKLDELPQLWNVVKGEMSLVGPRPEVPRYVEKYTPTQREILRLKPGITDLASLRFRGEELLLGQAQDVETFYLHSCVPRKIALNQEYARQANLLTDTWLIVQTICPAWMGVFFLNAFVLTAALWLSFWMRYDLSFSVVQWMPFAQKLAWMVPLQSVLLWWRGQCSSLLDHFSLPELKQVVLALSAAFGLGLIIDGAIQQEGCSPGLLLVNFMTALLGISGLRLILRLVRENAFHSQGRASVPCRIGIIGAGSAGAALARSLERERQAGARLIGFWDDDASKWHKHLHDIPVFGMPELLLEPGWREQLDQVLIAMPEASPERLRELRSILAKGGLRYQVVPSLRHWLMTRPMKQHGRAGHSVRAVREGGLQCAARTE